jgi:hypothetical protein
MEIKINVELNASAELLEAIRGLSQLTAGNVAEAVKAADPEPVKEVKKPAKAEKPEPKTETKVKPPSVEQLRELVREKAQSGHRETLKTILKNMGASSVTTLDESKYIEFKAEVEGL